MPHRDVVRTWPGAACALVLLWACGGAPAPAAPTAQRAAQSGAMAEQPTPPLVTSEPPSNLQAPSPPPQADAAGPCPDLDSRLLQVAQDDNPLERAAEQRLVVKDGKVQVLLILRDASAAPPEGYGLEIGTRSGEQVQAFAPVDQLCALANTEEVLAVRPPPQLSP